MSMLFDSSMCMRIRRMCYTGVQQLLPAVFMQPLDVKAERAKYFTETFDINIKESVCSLFTAQCTTGCGLSQVELDETNCNLHSCLLKIHLKKTKHNEFTICCFDPVVLNSHRMVTTKPRHVPNGDFCVLLITLPLTHHHTPELQVLS